MTEMLPEILLFVIWYFIMFVNQKNAFFSVHLSMLENKSFIPKKSETFWMSRLIFRTQFDQKR